MKNIAYLLIFALTTTTFFAGCIQEDIKSATVETSVTTWGNVDPNAGGNIDPSGISTLKVGDSKVYNIKTKEGYSVKSLKVRGVEQPIANTIEVIAIGSDVSFEIEVEFMHNNVILITEDYWFLLSLESYHGDVLYSSVVLTATEKVDRRYFNLDKTATAYHQGETSYFGIAKWEYFPINNTIKIGTDMMKIEVLTKYLLPSAKVLISLMEQLTTKRQAIGGLNLKKKRLHNCLVY